MPNSDNALCIELSWPSQTWWPENVFDDAAPAWFRTRHPYQVMNFSFLSDRRLAHKNLPSGKTSTAAFLEGLNLLFWDIKWREDLNSKLEPSWQWLKACPIKISSENLSAGKSPPEVLREGLFCPIESVEVFPEGRFLWESLRRGHGRSRQANSPTPSPRVVQGSAYGQGFAGI